MIICNVGKGIEIMGGQNRTVLKVCNNTRPFAEIMQFSIDN